MVDILDFMVVRAPEPVGAGALHRHYVHDRVVPPPRGMSTNVPPDPNLLQNKSPIGQLVFRKVFCESFKSEEDALESLLDALLANLTSYAPPCSHKESLANGSAPIVVEDLERHAYIQRGARYY